MEMMKTWRNEDAPVLIQRLDLKRSANCSEESRILKDNLTIKMNLNLDFDPENESRTSKLFKRSKIYIMWWQDRKEMKRKIKKVKRHEQEESKEIY